MKRVPVRANNTAEVLLSRFVWLWRKMVPCCLSTVVISSKEGHRSGRSAVITMSNSLCVHVYWPALNAEADDSEGTARKQISLCPDAKDVSTNIIRYISMLVQHWFYIFLRLDCSFPRRRPCSCQMEMVLFAHQSERVVSSCWK